MLAIPEVIAPLPYHKKVKGREALASESAVMVKINLHPKYCEAAHSDLGSVWVRRAITPSIII